MLLGGVIGLIVSQRAVLICPKGILWFNCVLRGKFHLPLLNGGGGGGGGLLIKWKSPIYKKIFIHSVHSSKSIEALPLDYRLDCSNVVLVNQN